VTNTNDAPTGSVTLSGTATQGQTLTAANTLADPDGLGTISYEWSAGGVVIAGASGSTLVLGPDQVGKAIIVTALYTDGGGTAERVSSAPSAMVITSNTAPSLLTLNPMLTDSRILENTSTSSPILVANIVISDDAQGSNTLSLTGADAQYFEIAGTALYLKAGVVLDFETQSSYQLAVQASDATLPASTPVSAGFTLTLVNVEEGTPVTPEPDPDPVLPPVTEWPDLPDDDGDGTPEVVEDHVKPLDVTGAVAGDGNGDGTADALQQSVASVPFLKTPTAVSNPGDAPPVFVSLVADASAGKPDTSDGNSAQLDNVVQKDAPANLPDEVKMPLGLISFNATVGLSDTANLGITETFSLYVDSSLGFNGYWKQDNSGNWVNLASSVTQEGGKTRIDFSLTDGGAFDSDRSINGVIADPGAPGVSARPEFGLREQVLALYIAYYDRAPDAAGLQYWLDQASAGLSLNQISAGFAQHPRFAQEYGGLDNAQIAAKLYQNVLHRDGDTAGIAYWTDELQSKPLPDVVASFTSSALSVDLQAMLANGSLSVADYTTAYQRQKVLDNLLQASEQFLNLFGDATTPKAAPSQLDQDPAYQAAISVLGHIDADLNAVYDQSAQLATLVGQADAMQAVVVLLA